MNCVRFWSPPTSPATKAVVIGNYRTSTVREVHPYTVYDAPVSAQGLLRWDLTASLRVRSLADTYA